MCASWAESDHDPFVAQPHRAQMGNNSRNSLAVRLSQVTVPPFFCSKR